ncbi:tol-pal system protein YbgF [Amylibacter kogurei]|uniref:Cell division coordinator CpoB n=1 Tax=Paramylibacter kogurei TaxID=1889778 RepID=A0A2G5K4S8_9RHOB|nr:tol-pal system protein YbgF [Amylibacter kogurei]PIB24023.1 tol-pal system protein YbgF [Amylibacter kogurei]
MKLAKSFVLTASIAFFAFDASAQDNSQTLADIRAEMTYLYAEIQNLRNELSETGNATAPANSGPALLRVDQVENDLRRITGQIEQLEYRIDQIVKDGTNRIGDLEFRLVELEGGDITQLGKTPTLGGDVGAAPSATVDTGAGMELAVAEKSDYETAVAMFQSGDAAGAETQFASFLQNYPGSPLTASAQYWQGEAQASLGNWNDASRNFLASLKQDGASEHAGKAMLGLGIGLARLGKTEQACQTLNSIATRYPNDTAVGQANAEAIELGCS